MILISVILFGVSFQPLTAPPLPPLPPLPLPTIRPLCIISVHLRHSFEAQQPKGSLTLLVIMTLVLVIMTVSPSGRHAKLEEVALLHLLLVALLHLLLGGGGLFPRWGRLIPPL